MEARALTRRSEEAQALQESDVLVSDPHLRRALRCGGLFGLGEACMRGEIDAHAADEIIVRLMRAKHPDLRRSPRTILTLLNLWLRNPQRGKGAFTVGRRHYDLGNDLFGAMLDRSMSYTCGYWRSANCLEQAQTAKLELICQKLKLERGMRVLDVGCGWGNFAEFAARHYGVSVTGLTISQEQAAFARERCKALPVEIKLQDYAEFRGQFERIVSIEMIEAVGKRNLSFYFSRIASWLPQGGLALIQAISAESFTRHSDPALDQLLLWLMKYIFPNGYLPAPRDLVEAGRSGLVIEEIENFAEDYDKTLKAWRTNFEQAWPLLVNCYSERFRRMWLYYLGACMAVFRLGSVQLFQIVYSKDGGVGGSSGI